jgi:ribosomal silencing factor RsfS
MRTHIEAERVARNIGSNALKDAKKAMGVKARREGGKDGRWFLYPAQSTLVADGEEEKTE